MTALRLTSRRRCPARRPPEGGGCSNPNFAGPIFHGWPDAPIPANLYVPEGAVFPGPAILAPHGHAKDGKAHEVYQYCHINLARRGYIVLAWDMIGFGEREAMGHFEADWPLLAGLSLKGLLLIEGQALLSWLAKQEIVDERRIGCTGNSGGGAQTLLLAALDERVAAAAPAGHVSPLSFIAGKEKTLCACTVLPNVIPVAEIEHILGLIAPRPAAIISGRDDCLFPDDLVRRAHRLGRRIYALEGATDRLELFVGMCGHGYEQPKREGMYAFFDRVLKHQDVHEVHEPPTEPEPADSPALGCWHGARPDFCTVRELARRLAGRVEARSDTCLWRDVLNVGRIPEVRENGLRCGPDGWNRIVLSVGGVKLPCLLAVPAGRAGHVTVIADDAGKDSARAAQCALIARRRGGAALAVDLLGWGETRPRELDPQRGDDETFAAQRGLFFGRPLLGERAAELLAVTRWLLSAHASPGSRVRWEAFGWAGLVAVLASAGKPPGALPPFDRVRVHDLPIRSFWDETPSRRPRFTFPWGVLSTGDLGDLVSPWVSFEA